MKKTALILFIFCFACVAFCKQPLRTQVRRTVSRTRLAQSARAELQFEWKKQEYLEKAVRFRAGRKIRVPYPAEYKTTQCAGVLLNNARVATAASCLKEAGGFKLQKITVSFPNGKSGAADINKTVINEEITLIVPDPAAVQGITGMEAASVAQGRTLQDVYGKEIASALQDFLISRGVVSARASRLTGRKASIKKGEPFFWKGKPVAVFNSVPKRVPVSLFGQIPEDFLAVFRS